MAKRRAEARGSPAETVERALRFHRRGEVDRAMPLYAEVLRVDPENAEAHHYLALACAQRGDPGTAMRHLREAVRLRPAQAVRHI